MSNDRDSPSFFRDQTHNNSLRKHQTQQPKRSTRQEVKIAFLCMLDRSLVTVTHATLRSNFGSDIKIVITIKYLREPPPGNLSIGIYSEIYDCEWESDWTYLHIEEGMGWAHDMSQRDDVVATSLERGTWLAISAIFQSTSSRMTKWACLSKFCAKDLW